MLRLYNPWVFEAISDLGFKRVKNSLKHIRNFLENLWTLIKTPKKIPSNTSWNHPLNLHILVTSITFSWRTIETWNTHQLLFNSFDTLWCLTTFQMYCRLKRHYRKNRGGKGRGTNGHMHGPMNRWADRVTRWHLIAAKDKNSGHDMAIVGEPCNVNSHANIPALFMTILCLCLGVQIYCTHWLWQYSCLVGRSEHCIHPGDTTHTSHTHPTHTKQTESNVELGFPN